MNSFALRSASRPARHFPRNGRSFRGGSAFFSHPPHAARVLPEWGGVSSTSLPLSVQASSSSRCWSRRHLQNSGRGSVADHDREDVRASGRRVWRNSRGDGAGTTRAYHCASSTLRVIWTRSANSHTGRRLCSCRIQGRTDDSIRPRATTTPTFSLARRGASTDGERTFTIAACGRPSRLISARRNARSVIMPSRKGG